MTVEEDYLTLQSELKSTELAISLRNIISCLDLTLLELTASVETLNDLAAKANQHQVAALCIFPEQLSKIAIPLTVKCATVVNFPEGKQSPKAVLSAINQIITEAKADEIDYVFHYELYFSGQKKAALSACEQAYQLCQQANIGFKIILETAALPSLEAIYQLSRILIAQGCDFLKTSTGKITQGATLAAAFAILKAIKESQSSCGLKVSGGIKTPEQAYGYINLAQKLLEKEIDPSWFRIGASSLLNELINI